MSAILLNSSRERGVTLVPNCFIDEYMPVASGSYVKVYLYLLRCMNSSTDVGITISSIADHLDETEKDIIRALCYWEKVSLITLERNEQQEIVSITVNEPDYKTPDSRESHEAVPSEAARDAKLADEKKYPLETPQASYEEIATSKTAEPPRHHLFEKPTYSEAQIKQLTENDEVKWLLNIIEIYLERLIKPSDMQLILYLYESLGFSAELIMYLYEYCISKNKKNPSYIEAVALSWAEEGIDTVEKAEASTALYNSNYNAINKAFGLNRAPGQIEKQYIEKWLNKFAFSIEIIIEACNRTILLTQKPDFKYTDKILENWHKKGVKELSQISKLDKEHATDAAKASTAVNNYNKAPQQPRPSSQNRFNAFPQRSYTDADYSSMEQKLLQKKMN
ncbi:DnaD domain protein [Anaerocolumna xylanovorans]|uniref:DnaD and phage-associated domain-containing protein n=1 Tax=Anaerocolumna xylanovorans DSM 12503 TaxID=1121345 RepID=A0A1M7Y6P3_9FIRM|nr:DnaD domain protein [Anaerocolumna xylanovorans]SHO48188.1 DnaD and phage-associated domain-containing protein [Anaerocolumna xylanovorans DSM 12503]